jgi:hypothetical protein
LLNQQITTLKSRNSFSVRHLVEMRQGLGGDALKAFRQGRDIITQLMRRSPENVTLPKDLAWFDSQIIAAHKK